MKQVYARLNERALLSKFCHLSHFVTAERIQLQTNPVLTRIFTICYCLQSHCQLERLILKCFLDYDCFQWILIAFGGFPVKIGSAGNTVF